MTEYQIGQEIMYTYQGRHYADVIDHISVTRTWVSTEYNAHFVDIENIITPGTAPMRSITPVARPRTPEQIIQAQAVAKVEREALRTTYEDSLTSMVNVYEMNRLHESISAMHKAHAIDLAIDAGNVELFKQLTEGASSV